MTTPSPDPHPVGTLVQARPWVSGKEAYLRPGIVVDGNPFFTDCDTVWFPSMGEFSPAEAGRAVQAIGLDKIIEVTGSIDDYAESTLKRFRRHVLAVEDFDGNRQLIAAIDAAARKFEERKHQS